MSVDVTLQLAAVQVPLQQCCPPGHGPPVVPQTHLLSTHVRLESHLVMQSPQCSGSVLTLTQPAPPQHRLPVAHGIPDG
jgi:hypothetical protein